MLTRIEIDGFKTFENFSVDLQPFTAIVGPNASGKSNLFDAIRFLSLLAQGDIRSAMAGIRGEPDELFRWTETGRADRMTFAVETLIGRRHVDAFGKTFETRARRLRYELVLGLLKNGGASHKAVVVQSEQCKPIARDRDRAGFVRGQAHLHNAKILPFIKISEDGSAIEVKQDGPNKHGRPTKYPLKEATRTTLSTISSSEFPHLYALKELLAGTRFLEINPKAARSVSDRFEERALRADASNLAAALASLKEETATEDRPNGVLSEIAADLSSMIPSVRDLEVRSDPASRQISFALRFAGTAEFSSRVISDGTLRLLALLTLIDDPARRGTLCFEEPGNGVHEGRLPLLVKFLRDSAHTGLKDDRSSFQILVNTHSPQFMRSLEKNEIVAADVVAVVDPLTRTKSFRTRMRAGIEEPSLFPTSDRMSSFELERLLQSPIDAA